MSKYTGKTILCESLNIRQCNIRLKFLVNCLTSAYKMLKKWSHFAYYAVKCIEARVFIFCQSLKLLVCYECRNVAPSKSIRLDVSATQNFGKSQFLGFFRHFREF